MKTIVLAAALLAAAASPAPAQQRQPETLESIMAADANKDGGITWAEAEAAKWNKGEFERGDRDKDGKVTLEELKAAIAAAGEKR